MGGPIPSRDPYDLMTQDEYESYRGKLLAINHDGYVVGVTEVPEDEEDVVAPILRLQEQCKHLSPEDWFAMAGPPTGSGIPLDDLL